MHPSWNEFTVNWNSFLIKIYFKTWIMNFDNTFKSWLINCNSILCVLLSGFRRREWGGGGRGSREQCFCSSKYHITHTHHTIRTHPHPTPRSRTPPHHIEVRDRGSMCTTWRKGLVKYCLNYLQTSKYSCTWESVYAEIVFISIIILISCWNWLF